VESAVAVLVSFALGCSDPAVHADSGPAAFDAGGRADASSEDGAIADAGVREDGGGPDAGFACVADPAPATLSDEAALFETGTGRIEWGARDGNTLAAFVHRPADFDPISGPILFVIHGAERNADGYLAAFTEMLDRHAALGIAPEWPTELYSSSESFNFGVGTDGSPRGGTYDASEWRDPIDYTMSEVEHLFEAVRAALGSTACDYRIYGHSAGGQFVHRFLTFRPDARVRRAVAANAGWYTLPSNGGGDDENFFVPYGLEGAPPDPDRQRALFAHRLVVLLGEDDVDTMDPDLRRTTEADAQGPHRFARGNFYFETARAEAETIGVPFEWSLATVPGVGHSNSRMAPASESHLFE
jgi:pimeloyl-ACP methyl ester carboxylesterase